MDAATKRRLLLYAAGGLIVVPNLAFLGSLVYGGIKKNKAVKAIAEGNDKNGVTLDELLRTGVLPPDTEVFKDQKAIVSALNRNADDITRNPFKRLLARVMSPAMAREVVSGSNAFYLGRGKTAPRLALSGSKIDTRVVRHEVGHYKADMLRKNPGDYMREHYDSANREGTLAQLFAPGKKKDGKGRNTVYGLEDEAWNLSGVPENDPLRAAALDSYRAASFRSSMRRASLISAFGGIGLGIYALKKYPYVVKGINA